MDEREFKRRTKRFALGIVALVGELPRSVVGQTLGRQLLRAGTSVGANYRAACRAKSGPDMAAKLAIVEEEADESISWLELLVEAEVVSSERAEPFLRKANGILAMIVASIKTIRGTC